MKSSSIGTPLARGLAALLSFSVAAHAADEACTVCGGRVTVSGEFSHSKEPPYVPIAGTGADADAYHEDINGPRFTVTVSNLPSGTYTIAIGAVEMIATAAAERVFDVSAGDVVLAKDIDLFATAGGSRKVAVIRGSFEKADDALRGPLQLSFIAHKGRAKFNTISISDGTGTEIVAIAAREMADAFTAAATIPPVVKEPAIWRNPSKPLRVRADDLIRRMALAEKVSQLKNAAPAIPRLGLPAYDYWNEALHGVANNGFATVFPEPIGAAASWNPALFRLEGHVIGIEGRAKFNDYANSHHGDSKWWSGLTYWTPNVNIFRDPRWGRGQETYGEDPYLTAEIGIAYVKGIQGDDPRYMLAMACAKHYAVHSGPEIDRHSFIANISDRDLFDTYLPQFERIVREGKVTGVMSAYNSVNGVPSSANAFLLTELVRQRWGFEGYIVSDCDAIRDITPAQEGESFDRASIELPKEQEDLLQALHATGKPVVMVNCSGSAMALTWEDEHLPAIVQAWYPGQDGGRAAAEVLFGVVSPSGHLPVTFYRSTADLPDFADYSMKNRTYRYFAGKPLYAFGHGLSYTKFDYANLRATATADGVLNVVLDVTNSGPCDGDDVVQLYVKPPTASQPQEIRALCGFSRVHLRVGERKTITIAVPAVALRRWSLEKKAYAIPAGDWLLAAGESSADLRQTVHVNL